MVDNNVLNLVFNLKYHWNIKKEKKSYLILTSRQERFFPKISVILNKFV